MPNDLLVLRLIFRPQVFPAKGKAGQQVFEVGKGNNVFGDGPFYLISMNEGGRGVLNIVQLLGLGVGNANPF